MAAPAHSSRATDYARRAAARNADKRFGPLVRRAAKRHLDDLKRQRTPGFPFEFREDYARHFENFASSVVPIPDPQGGAAAYKPMRLLDYQAFIAGNLFGWVHYGGENHGMRRFRDAYIETGKGSGKSPFGALIVLYMFLADGETNPSCYVGAETLEQAGVVFDNVRSFINNSFDRSLREGDIVERRSRGNGSESFIFKPPGYRKDPKPGEITRFAGSGRAMSGFRTHCLIMDESHEWSETTFANFDIMGKNRKDRKQPLIVTLTNTPATRGSPGGRVRSWAVEAVTGERVAETEFAFIAGLDKDDDPHADETCWEKCIPSLNELGGMENIRAEKSKALNDTQAKAELERLYFCRGAETAVVSLIPSANWAPLETDDLGAAMREHVGEDGDPLPAVAGLDLSDGGDLTALVAVWFDPAAHRMFSRAFVFIPQANLTERVRNESLPYPDYIDKGHVISVPGLGMDLTPVVELIGGLREHYNLRGISFDAYRMDEVIRKMKAAEIPHWLVGEKQRDYPIAEKGRTDQLALYEHGQGSKMTKATGLWMPSSMEALRLYVNTRTLKVQRNPVFSHHVTYCARLRTQPNGARVFDRTLKDKLKDDAAVALTMACGLVARHLDIGARPEPPPRVSRM